MSDGIRTRDVQIHSLALYQAELRSPLRPSCLRSLYYSQSRIRSFGCIGCNIRVHDLIFWG